MTPEQIRARDRALEMIARADAALAEPWTPKKLIESRPVEIPVRKTVERAAPTPRAQPAARYVTDAHLTSSMRSAAKATGTIVKEALDERDAKIRDLEQRLTALEALIAKAKGAHN